MSTESSYYGNGYWWLRSPNYDNSYYVRGVFSDGDAFLIYYVNYSSGGVVPALQIRL